MGGQKTPALGFAMGLERLILIMENQGISFAEDMGCSLYIAPMDESAVPYSMKLAAELRSSGLWVEYDTVGRGLKAQMKYSDKLGAAFTMVLGENELNENKAKLKNMKTGEETEIMLDSSFGEHFSDIAIGEMFGEVLENI